MRGLQSYCLVLFALQCAAEEPPRQLGWETGSVKHGFYDTPMGQLHYVKNDLSHKEAPAIVYFHAHPRSNTEVRHVYAELKKLAQGGPVPFLAVDWFGMGWSDAFKGRGTSDDDRSCSFEEFAKYTLEILGHEGVNEFVPFGWLKGANPALEAAHQAGKDRVSHLMIMGGLIMSSHTEAYLRANLIPMEKTQKLFANGSHIVNPNPFNPGQWERADATDPEFPDDLVWNQEKTVDSLRQVFEGWKYQVAWVNYNKQNVQKMTEVDSYAETLMIHPTIAYNKWQNFGLDPYYSMVAWNTTFKTPGHSHQMNISATEGMLHQNASLIAGLIHDFLKEPIQSRPVVV